MNSEEKVKQHKKQSKSTAASEKDVGNATKLFRVIGMAVLIVLLLAAVIYFISDRAGLGLFNRKEENKSASKTGLITAVSPETVMGLGDFDGGFVLLTNSDVRYVDADGNNTAVNSHNYSAPLMDVNGKNVLIYNKGGKAYRIEKSTSVFSDYTVNSSITCAVLGKANNYAYSLDSDSGYQSHVFVYTVNGKKQFEWASASEYCLALALSDSGNRLAISLLGAENAEYYSKVMLFDFNSSEPEYELTFSDKTVYDIDFLSSSRISVFTDGGVYIIDRSGNITSVQDFSSSEIDHSHICPDGLRATVISMYGNDQTPLLTVFDEKNKVLYSHFYYERINSVVCSGSYVCVSLNDRIEVLNSSDRVLGSIPVGERCERFALSKHNLYALTADGVHSYNLFFDTEHAEQTHEDRTTLPPMSEATVDRTEETSAPEELTEEITEIDISADESGDTDDGDSESVSEEKIFG